MVTALIQTDAHAKQIATRAREFANECHPKSSNMLLNGNFSGHLPVQLVLNEILRHPLGTFRKTLSRVFCIIPDRIVLMCDKRLRDLKLSETTHPLYPKCRDPLKNFRFMRILPKGKMQLMEHDAFRLNNSQNLTKFICILFAQYCIVKGTFLHFSHVKDTYKYEFSL